MERWLRFSGILGLIILFFGLILTWVNFQTQTSLAQPLTLLHVFFGGALIVLYFVTIGLKNKTNASSDNTPNRVTRFTANAAIYTAIVVGILVGINWIAKHHDKRWDLTSDSVYSLSPQSADLVKNLSQPLKIVGFKLPEGTEELSDLLELYKSSNPGKVSTEFVDPRSKPHLVDQYEMKQGNIVYMEYGAGAAKSVSRVNDPSEQSLTNAILKLTRGAAKKIYYVQGHQEPELEGMGDVGLKAFADAVSDEHLNLEGIVLGEHTTLPDDTGAVLLVSPKRPLLESERNLLIKYVDDGGRLVMMTDPRTTDDVKVIAAKFNIKVGDDIIIDQQQRAVAGPPLGLQPIVNLYGKHPITKDFSKQSVTVYNMASSVTAVEEAGPKTAVSIAKTGPNSWAETDLAGIFDSDSPSAAFDGNDTRGPISIAAAYEKKDETAPPSPDSPAATEPKFAKDSRVVVFGDSDWIINVNLKVYANRDFVLNALNWAVGEDGGITLRPKSLKTSTALLDAPTFLRLLTTSLLLPELILLFGLVVWWRRKAASAAA